MTIEPFVSVPLGVLPSPRRLLGLADTVVRVRGEVQLAEQRNTTMVTLAAVLAAQGVSAVVTSREPGGAEWDIQIGSASEAPQP